MTETPDLPPDPFRASADGPFRASDDDTAARLRDSLARHAADAPDGGLLAERILHAVDRQGAPARTTRRRIRWAAPLSAAAALIVLAGVVVGITELGRSDPHRVAGSPGPLVSGSRAPSATRSATPTERPASATPASTAVQQPNAVTALSGVKIIDVTFDRTDDGWALGTADCPAGHCLALFHTSDGTTWRSRGGDFGFNVPGVTGGCAAPCVTNIRFADTETGYAYGPSAFFMTTDGGAHWVQQPGQGAIALETLQQNVIRVTSTATDCPGPCGIAVQTADIGGTDWTTRTLGRAADAAAVNVFLSRGGSDAYLLVTRNPAGGASDETSTLYRSMDDGTSWRSAGEPCPQTGGETDSVAVAAGADGGVAVLCTTRQAPNRSFVAVSTDEGATFHATSGTVPAASARFLVGDPSTVLATADRGLARSTTGGASWTMSQQVTGTVSFVGFESDEVGRAVTGDNTIWTTRNRGATWTESRIA